VTQLLEVHEKNQIMTTMVWLQQEWYDHNLGWEPRQFGNVTVMHIPSAEIWLPQIVLYNK
jgi:nicotinic acetylcholine receptor